MGWRRRGGRSVDSCPALAGFGPLARRHCGDERPSIVVLGRESDQVRFGDRRFHTYEIIEAAAAAANAVDSSVFFTVVMPDRLLFRIETEHRDGDPHAAIREHLGDVRIEVERTPRNTLLDVEQLSRSPSVYKPVLVSDWRRPGRHVLSVSQGMVTWPRPSFSELRRLLARSVRAAIRARRLRRDLRAAKPAIWRNKGR